MHSNSSVYAQSLTPSLGARHYWCSLIIFPWWVSKNNLVSLIWLGLQLARIDTLFNVKVFLLDCLLSLKWFRYNLFRFENDFLRINYSDFLILRFVWLCICFQEFLEFFIKTSNYFIILLHMLWFLFFIKVKYIIAEMTSERLLLLLLVFSIFNNFSHKFFHMCQ